jgi:Heparinase II/III-like protein/Heparinase II/III N-terminus
VQANLPASPDDLWPSEQRIAQWAAAFQRLAARLAYRAFPQLASSALAMRAAALEPSGMPRLFSRDLREIPPALNEDLLDLYGKSEQALANRFAFLNLAEILPPDFDWDMHESSAWGRELHAFDYGLDLALTYRISQEERYGRHLRYLVAHWIASNPPGQTAGWEPAALARRIRNWILAADLARDDWERDPAFLGLFQHSLALQCAFLEGHAEQAIGAISFGTAVDCARALLVAGKLFQRNRGKGIRDLGQAILSRAVETAFPADGGPPNLRPPACLHLAEALMECLVFDLPDEDDLYASIRESARQTIRALEGTLLPDGTLPLFGSSARLPGENVADLFALAAVIFDQPEWKGLAGKFGILPYMMLGEAGKSRFERLGQTPWQAGTGAVPELEIYRLSAPDRSALIANARPEVARDEHQDFLSYELSIAGQRLVVDSGAYSPEGESWDKYFASARAHNVLLVDDEASRPGSAHEPHPQEWKSAEGFERLSFGDGGFRFLGVEHQRAFFRLEGGAWAVLDRLAGRGRHTLLNLVHFYPTFEVEARDDRALVRSRSLNATVIPLGSGSVRLMAARGQHPRFCGFYSPDFGVKFPSATLVLETPAAPLPWLGGYLILSGRADDLRPGQVNAAEGTVSFRLSGKNFCLAAG